MTLLVTGHGGFVGSHLLARHGGAGLVDEAGATVDLLDQERLTRSLQILRPDAVIHLAAQTFVPDAFSNPRATYEVNFIGTQNLLQGLRETGFKGRFLYVSSADVYGALDEADLPTVEATLPRPLNPYAVSKLAAETLCAYWQRSEGLDLCIARPFNHIGPGQSPRFSIADFSKAIAEMKAGRRSSVLRVGDLDVTRDFTDVRDVVDAYLLLLERGRSGETYNVCSGVERQMERAVRELAELAGVVVTLEIDSGRLRKSGQRRALGSHQKLSRDTGWEPTIAWRTSLGDMLNHWGHLLQ